MINLEDFKVPLLKRDSKNNENEIKKIINDNVASSMRTQPSFVEILKLNGCSSLKVGIVGGNIRKQLLDEAKNGELTAESVMPRAYFLIGEYLGIDDVKTSDDSFMDKPDLESMDGLNDAEESEYDFFCDIEEIRTNWAGEKRKDRRRCNVKVYDDRFILYKTGIFIKNDLGNRTVYYCDITGMDFDKAGLFHVTSSINIVIRGGEQITLIYVDESHFQLLNSKWREYKENIGKPQTAQIQQDISTASNADELLKYAELYEKGLLTKEEFDLKKSELLSSDKPVNAEETSSMDETAPKTEQKNKFCSNCGSRVEMNSKFCSNCGSKL